MIVASLPLLLAACTSGGDTGPADTGPDLLDCDEVDGNPCCADPSPMVGVAVEGIDEDVPVTGSFVDWDLASDSGARFVDAEGIEHDVISSGYRWVGSTAWEEDPEALAALGDLEAMGEVAVVQQGSYDPESGYHDALAIFDPGDLADPILVVGASEATDLGGFTLAAPPDVETCGGRAWSGCNPVVHNKPVEVTRSGESTTLFQGSSTVLDDYLVTVSLAWSGSGDYACDDGPGTDQVSWTIQPARR
jgi:hypothetical protein